MAKPAHLPTVRAAGAGYSSRMSRYGGTPPEPSSAPSPGSLWLLLASSLVAIAVALVPYACLVARHSPPWLALAAGLAVFPGLPLVWHGLAEARREARAGAPFSLRTRFALRALAVALLVLGVSLGDLGPRPTFESVRALAGHMWPKPPTKPTPLPRPPAPFGLEPYIPADATLVVGLSGSAAMEQLLAAQGVDTRAKLAALATCKIDLENARVLIAARDRQTHMVVVRAPGIADERDLYCLVGVMGPDRLQLRAEGGAKMLEVKGLLSRPLTFRVLDRTTMIAVDDSWHASVDTKLFTDDLSSAQGPLVGPLVRVDRGAPLWLASVEQSAQGAWDVALDSHLEGTTFKLQGSATPPSGAKDRAELSLRVPMSFASALPETAMALGIRGVMTAVTATRAALPPAAPAASPGQGRTTP